MTKQTQDAQPRGRAPKPSGSAEANALRDQIDQGAARDKIAAADPAAAPLGTDDEAAGHSPTVEEAMISTVTPMITSPFHCGD
jgi:hypothetical protein